MLPNARFANAPSAASAELAHPLARRPREGLWRAAALALLALLIGLSVSLWLWQDARRASRDAELNRFSYRTSRIRADMQHVLDADDVLLRSVSALFNVRDNLTRAQWRAYFRAVDPGQRT